MIAFIYTSVLLSATAMSTDTGGLPDPLLNQFASVPAGEVILQGEHFAVEAFYIARHEVSNAEYAKFLRDMTERGKSDVVRNAAVHPEGWLTAGGTLEPFAENYHSHASFGSYPVVNIPDEGARLYCAWLEEELNAEYGGKQHFEVSLPSRIEWLRAARPDDLAARYSWGANVLRTPEGKFLCNFNTAGSEQIQYGASAEAYTVVTGDDVSQRQRGTFTTAPCTSYSANILGIYNLNGNVAEMVEETGMAVGGSWNSAGYDVRNESVTAFEGPSPYVGFRPVVRVVE